MQIAGHFLVDKPVTWTSFDVVNKVRYLLRAHYGKRIKIGHAGTLDPLASGLLILCYGSMTKEINKFQDLEKEYTGSFKLGATTPSFDSETEIDREYPTEHISDELLHKKASEMTGVILQRPPLFSAKWVGGERAYHLARQGEQRELPPSQVEIHEFDIVGREENEVRFRVRCSKGTYIRSLARDLGKALDSGAYLTSLRRTAIGSHRIEEALSIDDLIDKLGTVSHENN